MKPERSGYRQSLIAALGSLEGQGTGFNMKKMEEKILSLQ